MNLFTCFETMNLPRVPRRKRHQKTALTVMITARGCTMRSWGGGMYRIR
jgi:hypothetical protein